jgi:hypothetical protein
VQFLGDDQAKHAVAEKFETLVGEDRAGAGMGERALQEFAVGEDVAQALFQISR